MPRGLWDPPGPGIEPMSPASAGGILNCWNTREVFGAFLDFFKIFTWQPLKAVMNPQVIRRKMGVRDIQLVRVGSEPAPEPCCPVPSLVLLLTSTRGADALLRVFCCGSACCQLPGDVTSSLRVSPASRSLPCPQSRSTPADSAAPNDVKLFSTCSVRSDI